MVLFACDLAQQCLARGCNAGACSTASRLGLAASAVLSS